MTEGQLAVNDGITRVFILIVYVSIALESNGAFMEKNCFALRVAALKFKSIFPPSNITT